jgi:hypothetical protein
VVPMKLRSGEPVGGQPLQLGLGNGTVNYSVASNTSNKSRKGTINIAGRPSLVINAGLSEYASERFEEWRARILDWLACPKIGIPLLQRLPNRTSPDIQEILCSMYGHTGEYRKAARTALGLAHHPEITSEQRLSHLISAAGSWFSHGSYFRYRQCMSLGALELRLLDRRSSRLRGRFLRMKLTHWMQLAQVGRATHLHALNKWVQNKVTSPLPKSSVVSRKPMVPGTIS